MRRLLFSIALGDRTTSLLPAFEQGYVKRTISDEQRLDSNDDESQEHSHASSMQ
jgi:hypothetical protein